MKEIVHCKFKRSTWKEITSYNKNKIVPTHTHKICDLIFEFPFFLSFPLFPWFAGKFFIHATSRVALQISFFKRWWLLMEEFRIIDWFHSPAIFRRRKQKWWGSKWNGRERWKVRNCYHNLFWEMFAFETAFVSNSWSSFPRIIILPSFALLAYFWHLKSVGVSTERRRNQIRTVKQNVFMYIDFLSLTFVFSFLKSLIFTLFSCSRFSE